MKLIQPKFEILDQEPGIEGVYKQIELAGRTCYHSQDRITEDSAKEFVERMIRSGHWSMLEHGTVYLDVPNSARDFNAVEDYYANNYSKVDSNINDLTSDDVIHNYITTNLRVLVENDWLDDLKYICEPTEFHERRVTVRFNTSVAITREFNRHRVNSPAEQSTRYCNYSKDKFDNEVRFVVPDNLSLRRLEEVRYDWDCENDDEIFRAMCRNIAEGYDLDELGTWLFGCLSSEYSYMRLLKLGWKPEDARDKLELDTASELVHTAFVSDWKHFFELRDANSAHHMARFLAHPLQEEFRKRGYIK